MKKSLLAAAVMAALMVPQVVGAESFGIVEWSTEGVATSGARMFAENDPANIAYNPASITKVKGRVMKVTATYLSPHDKFKVTDKAGNLSYAGADANGDQKNIVKPAWAPGSYYVRQMDEKNWLGFGAFARFGLASQFKRDSLAATNAFFSKMEGISFNPVLARKFDNKWSGAVGADINYVGLQMEKMAKLNPALPFSPSQLKGRSWALGWNAAVNYAFDDKNEVGVSYRSKVKHSLEADFKVFNFMGGTVGGKAYGVVTLPDQWSVGYSHKFDDKNRLEINGIRTNWNTYDALNIHLSNLTLRMPGVEMPLGSAVVENPKAFSYSWRYNIGYEHKFSQKYTGMIGTAYDTNSNHSGDFVVPTGNRRYYSAGIRYEDKKQSVSFAAGWIKLGDLTWTGGPTDAFGSAHSRDNWVKVFSAGYEYRF